MWGVVGNLGGGKSLSAVALGVQSMLQGYFVVSNITFDLDAIVNHYHQDWLRQMYLHISLDDTAFDPFLLPTGSPRGTKGGKRVIVILDEVAEWFDQYSSAKDPRIARLWSWLRHSSKRSQDVVIICQRREYINKVVRNLIARWIWVDDLAVWRIPKIRLRLFGMSGYVMQNVFDRLGNRIGAVTFLRKSLWGRFYNTAECLNVSGAATNFEFFLPPEKIGVSRGSLWLFLGSFFYLLKLLIT